VARTHRGHAEGGPHDRTTGTAPDTADVRRAEPELGSASGPHRPPQLPDRSLVVDALADALTRAEHSTAVLLVDLDAFRMINVVRGHRVGDRLLEAVDARLRAAVSAEETVARFGDDEFVVICEDTGEHAAHALACFLRNTLAEPFRIGGDGVHVTASIGVAASPSEAAVSAMDLLRHADTAVNAGKSAGRGRVHVFDQRLGADEAERYTLAADLPAALASGALHVEYQPIIDLREGAVVGLEALARWTHPERGAVPPSSFVRVAELTGMAPELDRWVIQQALADMAQLREAGVVPADAYLAVNLSVANLTDTQLFDHLLSWTERSGLPAGQVVLEITETAIMHDTDLAARLLGRLREQGIQVAMDDFGTGYSSLAQLRDLPLSALKIDRSFVAEIEEQGDALAIVTCIIDLARAVGVAVVAEGVETAEQAALLRRLGCASAQGWLWGPAVPVTALSSGREWMSALPSERAAAIRPPTAGCGRRDLTDAHGVDRLLELHQDGASIDTIAAALDAEGFRTPTGRRWHRSSVARLISRRIRRSAGTPDDFPTTRRYAGTASPVRFPPLVGDPDSRPPDGRGRRGGP
jgi:diguanylate cyclase (GGDEF)-like protein